MKNLLCSLVPLALALSACSANVSSSPPAGIDIPRRLTNAGLEMGRAAGRPFKAYQAVLLEHFGDTSLLTMTIYGEDVANPCFGLGDAMLMVPVRRSPTILSRNTYSMTNSEWMAQFWMKTGDTSQSVTVPGGFLEVTSFDGKAGSASIEVGHPAATNFIKGDFRFENCVVSGW